MPPGAEQTAIRELAAAATGRVEALEERFGKLSERVDKLADAQHRIDLVLTRIETVDATRQAQRGDWRATAAAIVGAISGLAAAAKAFGVLG